MITARSRNLRTTPSALLAGPVKRRAASLNALRRAWPPAITATTIAVTVAACSTFSGMTGSTTSPAPTATSPLAPSDSSFSSRVKSFFTGDSGKLASPAAATTTTGAAASQQIECPSVEYRQDAATWTVNSGPSGENAALNVKYLGSFTQTARECIVTGDNLTIKVGVQGRIVVGPAGSAGTVNVPLRYALVREGLHPQPIWSKLYMVPVTIPPSDLNVKWLHVEEDMTVPRPPAEELEGYVIYVGFDPEGANGARSKPAAKPKTARGR